VNPVGRFLDSGEPRSRFPVVMPLLCIRVAPRAYCKGYLKLSLVSCPIALSPVTSNLEKIFAR
jgi:hypothetical protein